MSGAFYELQLLTASTAAVASAFAAAGANGSNSQQGEKAATHNHHSLSLIATIYGGRQYILCHK